MDQVTSHLVDELQGQGILVLTADDGERYDLARRVWNGDIDRFPSAIVACLDTVSVVSAVKACARRKLPVTVRGGGHNVAGHAVADDTVMIDVCDRTVVVSDDSRTVSVGGGAIWADVDAATAPLGMHVPAGLISHTGVAGLTLGGGIGWLARMYGLTCDSMVEATLVTASGKIVTGQRGVEGREERFK
jgi:FAD/FMN-containing dehydrogenase